jgi:hypothetical protein
VLNSNRSIDFVEEIGNGVSTFSLSPKPPSARITGGTSPTKYALDVIRGIFGGRIALSKYFFMSEFLYNELSELLPAEPRSIKINLALASTTASKTIE